MTTGELLYVLGIITGLILGLCTLYPWGHRNGHLDGYQDHRAEVIDRANEADARKAPGAELEPIRAKTAPLPPWYQDMPGAVPYGLRTARGRASMAARPFPRASSRVATTAADIGPVFVPATDATRIPMRPQPGRDSGPGTAILEKLRTTGEWQQIADDTETIIQGILAGTWPPPEQKEPSP